MKTSVIIGVVVVVLIVVAAAGFLLFYSPNKFSTTSSLQSSSVSSSSSSSTYSSTSSSTHAITNTTPTPTPTQTKMFSIDGLFSPSNATEATGVSNYVVVSYLEVENLNSIMDNLKTSGSSGMAFQPSTSQSSGSSNYYSYLKYMVSFFNYSSPMYIEVLAHNTSSYISVIAFNYNTSSKGASVAQLISGLLGAYLKNSSTGSYNGLQYVYGVYEQNNTSSSSGLPGNMTVSYNVTLGVAYGYTYSGKVFFVLTYGLPNDSSSAFNTLKIVSMRASGHIPSPPMDLISTAFPRIEYGYLNASFLQEMYNNKYMNQTFSKYNITFNSSLLTSLKYINITSVSEGVYAKLSSPKSFNLVALTLENTTNGTELTHMLNVYSQHIHNATVYFNGTKDGARMLVVFYPKLNVTEGIAVYGNYEIMAVYYSSSKVDQGAYIISLLDEEISLIS